MNWHGFLSAAAILAAKPSTGTGLNGMIQSLHGRIHRLLGLCETEQDRPPRFPKPYVTVALAIGDQKLAILSERHFSLRHPLRGDFFGDDCQERAQLWSSRCLLASSSNLLAMCADWRSLSHFSMLDISCLALHGRSLHEPCCRTH